MNPTATGKSTSEFQLTLVTSVVSALIALIALIHPGFHVSGPAVEAIVSVAIGVIGLASSVYSHGRSNVKAAAITADGVVKASPNVEMITTLPSGQPQIGGQF